MTIFLFFALQQILMLKVKINRLLGKLATTDELPQEYLVVMPELIETMSRGRAPSLPIQNCSYLNHHVDFMLHSATA